MSRCGDRRPSLFRLIRRRRALRCEWDGGWDAPPDAGCREPRRPYPNAGAGAFALPEPHAAA
ncbi:MAG TPA: hypothetical protein DIU14_10815 [Actinobacteria bacterium]|nr:hypothetical protein [Actinomycetota bacterium]